MLLIHQVVLIPLVMMTCHYRILDDAIIVVEVWKKKKWMLMVDFLWIVALERTWNCVCNNWEDWKNTLLLLLMTIQKRNDDCCCCHIRI